MKTFRTIVLLSVAMLAGVIFSGACGGGTSVTVISSITPANEATDVALASPQVTVVFGTDIDPTVLNSTNVILTKTTGGTNAPGTISYDATTRTMTFTPTPSLAYQTGYTLTLKQAIHSALTADVTSTFTVKDVPLALLSTYNPNDPATPFNVGNLWLIDSDGANMTQFTTYTSTTEGSVSGFGSIAWWAPDYSKILYCAGNPTEPTMDLYSIDTLGTTPINLTNNATGSYPLLFKWLPDTTAAVYSMSLLGPTVPPFNLFTSSPDGSAKDQITNYSGNNSVFPYNFAISPDSAYIAFMAGDFSITPPGIDLHIIDTDGTNDTTLATHPLGGFAAFPLFSIDGSLIFFSRGTEAAGISLNSINLDGSNLQTLIPATPNTSIAPFGISPTGSQLSLLVTDASVDPALTDLYLVNTDGSSLIKITNSDGTNVYVAATWSPDGSHLVYLYGNVDNGPVDLYVVNNDGSGRINLTNFSSGQYAYVTAATQYFNGMGLPVAWWSSDGSRIFYNFKDSNLANLTVIRSVNIDGSNTADFLNLSPANSAITDWW